MRLRSGLLALVVVWPALASAQESAAVLAARAHFQQAHAAAAPAGLRAAASTDLDDLHAVDAHRDGRAGVTYVRLVQRHAGVEVFGTVSTAAVLSGGDVVAGADRFESGLALRTNAPTPSVPAAAAVAAAEAVARREALAQERLAPSGPPVLTDDPVVDRQRAADRRAAASRPLDPETTEPRLGYHEAPGGALRLAWETVVSATGPHGGQILRRVRLDAHTGEVLADDDLVAYDTWPHPEAAAPRQGSAREPAPVSYAPLRHGRAGAYRVIPAPFESPSHGTFALVTSPANPVASPRGWHDDGTQTYTITRGNNVWAYTDVDFDNEPDAGSSPDGGSALVFDFPFDPALAPAQNAAAAVTNLFYWNNTAHDIAYRYGFDEAAGNFQRTNFTGQGAGGDFVFAEALDGSDSNNASFGTPPDGRSPRMQMYRWSGGFVLEVTSPQSLAGSYPSVAAGFGPGGGFTGTLVPVRGPNGETLGCGAAQIVNDVQGKVALIQRGECNFVDKVLAAQEKGAIGVLVYNRPADPNTPGDNGGDVLIVMGTGPEYTGPIPSIPSAFVTQSTGVTLAGASVPVTVSASQLADRDSGLDAGVVVHEYAHGISNRLIGGPLNVGCLTNGYTSSGDASNNRPGEQMGEGWSDFYGMILTQRPGDTGRQPRGVGTYLQFENPDGPGIRPAPYSTDFSINDYTYQDVIAHAAHAPSGSRGLSIPHGVGFAWATMLWEMTWELIGAHGYSEDLYDAGGTAGNQIALNLVTTGLKLTPCTPGFVDGRDAILAADQALYGGAHADLIWRAFARRGLGIDASQGSEHQHNDGRADFTAPDQIQGAVTLSVSEVEATALPGAESAVTFEIVNDRTVPQDFSVDTAALPAWLDVTPASGTVPAGGTATLTATAQPGPLDVGTLEAVVPVSVGASTRLQLKVRVETNGTVDGTHALSPVGPNPSRSSVRFTLAVAQGQTVEASLFDTLGRRVLTTSKAFSTNVRQALAFDVSGLASGVYVLQVAGDTFRETRTITVVR